MVGHLMHVQPELGSLLHAHFKLMRAGITEQDRICVKLAGLCHDIGHGPFSHMFERFVNRKREARGQTAWCHEHASVELFRLLIQANNINLRDYNLEPCDVEFVVHLIQVSCIYTCPYLLHFGRP
jgi:HD superfamily phosphohydrolase